MIFLVSCSCIVCNHFPTPALQQMTILYNADISMPDVSLLLLLGLGFWNVPYWHVNIILNGLKNQTKKKNYMAESWTLGTSLDQGYSVNSSSLSAEHCYNYLLPLHSCVICITVKVDMYSTGTICGQYDQYATQWGICKDECVHLLCCSL